MLTKDDIEIAVRELPDSSRVFFGRFTGQVRTWLSAEAVFEAKDLDAMIAAEKDKVTSMLLNRAYGDIKGPITELMDIVRMNVKNPQERARAHELFNELKERGLL